MIIGGGGKEGERGMIIGGGGKEGERGMIIGGGGKEGERGMIIGGGGKGRERNDHRRKEGVSNGFLVSRSCPRDLVHNGHSHGLGDGERTGEVSTVSWQF